MGSSNSKASVLLIDVQNDFHANGSLAVSGADEDARRIAEMIKANVKNIEDIYVTLDSHNREHIAHAASWNSKDDGSGEKPTPFTLISSKDIADGVWFPTDKPKDYCLQYAKALEEKGHFQLTIWPDHCIMGTEGHKVVPVIQEALDFWLSHHPEKKILTVEKGMNNMTEMYSAIAAEVPVPDDPLTSTNYKFLEQLKKSKKLVICGQALSHCVNYTTRDILKDWAPRKPADLIILSDGSSSVTGCEEAGEKFKLDMKAAGATIKLTADAFKV